MTTLHEPATRPAFRRIGTARRARNLLATALVTLAFLLAVAPLVWVLWTVVGRGIGVVVDPDWWHRSLSGLTSRQAGGGAYHAIVGTLAQGLACALLSVPVGILVAVHLVEYGGRSRLARATTFAVDVLAGVPSIVAALFVYALWITTFGFERSGFAVALALVLLMVPVVVRATEEMLRTVPDELREAAYALGVPKWRTVLKVVLPTAAPGITTGVMIALARVMGETAPLLVLVGYAPFINHNLFDGEMASLPLLAYVERNTPTQAGFERVWGAAVTLVLLITVLNLVATTASRLAASRRGR